LLGGVAPCHKNELVKACVASGGSCKLDVMEVGRGCHLHLMGAPLQPPGVERDVGIFAGASEEAERCGFAELRGFHIRVRELIVELAAAIGGETPEPPSSVELPVGVAAMSPEMALAILQARALARAGAALGAPQMMSAGCRDSGGGSLWTAAREGGWG
jgi:hypothetical protein